MGDDSALLSLQWHDLHVEVEVTGEQQDNRNDQDSGGRREADSPVPAVAPATVAKANPSKMIRRIFSAQRASSRHPL